MLANTSAYNHLYQDNCYLNTLQNITANIIANQIRDHDHDFSIWFRDVLALAKNCYYLSNVVKCRIVQTVASADDSVQIEYTQWLYIWFIHFTQPIDIFWLLHTKEMSNVQPIIYLTSTPWFDMLYVVIRGMDELYQKWEKTHV